VSLSDGPVVSPDAPATSSDDPPVVQDEPAASVDDSTIPSDGATALTGDADAPTVLTDEQEADTPTDEPATPSEEAAAPSGEPDVRSSPSEPDVSTEPRPGPPEEIPRVADLAIEYDELVDERPIGSGGNADVTRATYPTPEGDLTLAIKRPRISDTLDMKAIEGMLVEAEMWEKLDDHDHIVGVIDYGSEPLPWIAMEFMDGGHLREWAGRMDVPQALWTSIAITEGVRHAHRRGVAHLDLKPENILFRTVEDAWDVPKVADWGLSKLLLEHSRSIEGISPQYSAPEQFDPEYGRADDITDIYQLGAVLYELFAGRAPFEGPPTQVMRAVLDDEPSPPSEVEPDVPEALDEVILTALAKEKRDRFDNVAYLRDALQDLYDDWE
jgi:tRNA A-37 threonylcarbamoyl transferase component Bud32